MADDKAPSQAGWTEAERAAYDRYLKAAHGMQAGVGFKRDKGDQSPKHLRVGVNTALVQQAALVELLIDKGLFSRLEYFTKLAECMERERDSYAEEISAEAGGAKVTLV